jgi:hypothetical protein
MVDLLPWDSFDSWLPEVSEQTRWQVERLLASYRHWLGTPLLPEPSDGSGHFEAVYIAKFPVLAHGIEADPVLYFGNAAALWLWEMSWGEFTRMPSRLTAEADLQEERARVLHEVSTRGFSRNYTGIRISRSGRRFLIEDATVWNVLNEHGTKIGQAAMFHTWATLSP